MRQGAIAPVLVVLGMTASLVALASGGVTGVATAVPAVNEAPATLYQWEPINVPIDLATTPVTALAVHPTDAYTAYLATWDGLYKTTNAGQSWTRVATDTLGYVPDDVAFDRTWTFTTGSGGGFGIDGAGERSHIGPPFRWPQHSRVIRGLHRRTQVRR